MIRRINKNKEEGKSEKAEEKKDGKPKARS
jgi:hypothetical protein